MVLSTEEQQQKTGAIAGDKAALIDRVTAASSELEKALTKASSVYTVLNARGYAKGGAAEIAETDLLNKPFSIDEFHKVVELFGELQKLSAGQTVTTDTWGLHNAKLAG